MRVLFYSFGLDNSSRIVCRNPLFVRRPTGRILVILDVMSYTVSLGVLKVGPILSNSDAFAVDLFNLSHIYVTRSNIVYEEFYDTPTGLSLQYVKKLKA